MSDELVGYLVVEQESEYTQSYETAAWSTIHIIQTGRYPVYAKRDGGRRSLLTTVNTVIKSSYTAALYGGVQVGEYTDTRKGTKDTLVMGYGYWAYQNDVPFKRTGRFEAIEGADLRVAQVHKPEWAHLQRYALVEEVVQ